MRATHHAINYSDACDKGGDGQCDGHVPEGEGNPNASNPVLCTCPCHEDVSLPDTIEGVTRWHVKFHGGK